MEEAMDRSSQEKSGNKVRQFASRMILLVFAVWIAWYLKSHPSILETLRTVSLKSVAALFGVALVLIFCNGLLTKSVLRAFNVSLPHREAFSLAALTSAGNYLMPAHGGAAVRAVYLKTRFKFGFSDFLSTLMAFYLMHLAVNGGAGLLSMLALYSNGHALDLPIGLLFAGATASAALVMILPPRVSDTMRLPWKPLGQVLKGWSLIRMSPRLMAQLFLITAACTALMVVQTETAFNAFSVSLSWEGALFFASAKSLALLATLTPGALGIVEWLSMYMALTLSVTPEEALLAQGLMRAVTVATVFVVGPVAGFLGLHASGSGGSKQSGNPNDKDAREN